MTSVQWTQAQLEARTVASDFENRYRAEQGNAAIEYFDGIAQQEQTEKTMTQKVGETVGAVGLDVGLGVSQGYRSVARGAAKAVNNIAEFAQDVSDILPAVTILNKEGEASLPRVVSGGEARKRQSKRLGIEPVDVAALPVMDEPAKPTVTGSLIEAITQFAVGFGAAGKVAGALSKAPGMVGKVATAVQSSGFGGSVAKGVAADILAFDAHEQRLSNVIQQVPALQNPVTAFLSADPEDGQAEALFKQAVEGAVTGAAGEVLFRGVKALRNGRQAVSKAKQEGLTVDEIAARIEQPKSTVLGDETSTELLITRKVTRPVPDLTPEQVVGTASPDGQVKISQNGSLNVTAYHQTDAKFDAFDFEKSADGTMWFSTDVKELFREGSAAAASSGNKNVMSVNLSLKKVAGWDEMDKYSIDELIAKGYDGALLDGDVQVFNKDAITRIIETTDKNAFLSRAQNEPKPTGAARAPQEADEIAINFARIEGPDDVKNLMQSMANDPALLGRVQSARRGVVSDVQLKAAAEQEDAFAVLMARRTGQALNDQQILAARELYAQTTDRLLEAARLAQNGGSEDAFNFRKMLAVHSAVQSEVLGARAEAARALRAWSLPVGTSGRSRVRAVEDMLQQYGGVDGSQDLAKRLAAAADSGALTAEGINKIAHGGALARTTRALASLWQSGLLTSPRTHLVNVGSNVSNGLALGLERFGMAAVPGSPVKINEAFGFFVGYVGSFREALRNGAAAFRSGQSQFMQDRLEQPMIRATAREVLDPNGKLGFVSKAVDALGYFYERSVGAALAAGDDFGRTMLYNAELRAQAIRDANQLGLTGKAFDDHVYKMLNAPTDLMQDEALKFAKYGVFMQPLGEAGRAVQTARAKLPVLGFVLPFVQTPANIFKFTFGRTPLGLLSQKIRDDIAAGGAKGAARMAGMAMGTTMMMVGADMALQGNITGAGPSDPNLRQKLRASGWQPYSVKVGDRYISYQKIQPLGTWLALSANMTELLGNYENYDISAQQEVDKLATAVVASISDVVLSASFMTGAAEVTEMLADPKRYGEQWLNRYAGSVVPNIVADFEKAISPEVEEAFNAIDAMKARIPGMSDSVYKKRNVYGEEISAYYVQENSPFMRAVEGAGRVFNPLQFSDDDRPSNQLSEYFMVNGMAGVTMPNKVQNFPANQFDMAGSIPVDLREYPQIWDRFMQLRGEIKPEGYDTTLKQYLLDAVNGVNDSAAIFESKDLDIESKDRMVARIVSDYDNAIRQQLLDEFPVLQQTLVEEIAKQQGMAQPDTSMGLIRTRPLP